MGLEVRGDVAGGDHLKTGSLLGPGPWKPDCTGGGGKVEEGGGFGPAGQTLCQE